jgi:alkyldihydroxyacetonephosphate synthase
MLGSEGTMGIITEAWVRLQARPVFKVSASVQFDDIFTAAKAVREISQAGLYPSNCRVLDEAEVALNRVSAERCAILILGFESAHHSVEHWMDIALDIATQHGGRLDSGSVQTSRERINEAVNATESWRNAFIRMPYWRNYLTGFGVVADTFETAITWDKFNTFYRTIMQQLGADLAEVSGGRYALSCRFTHVYPDGPAPYFTFYFLPNDRVDLHDALAKWTRTKQRSMELIAELGGTVTHHHAVGRDHRYGYEQQTSPLFRQSLAGAKQQLDPHSIMNPGALIDPLDQAIGIRGIMEQDRA